MDVKSEHITSVGIELEGGLSEDDYSNVIEEFRNNNHFSMGSDGSVHTDRDHGGIEMRIWDTVENKLKSMDELLNYVFNETDFISNESCGYHTHVKFVDLENCKILSYPALYHEFLDCYKSEFGKKDKYMKRFTNQYCVAKWSMETIQNQLASEYKDSSRRNAINFNSLNGPQRTIEFRIFPWQADYYEATETVRWTVNTLNKIFNDTIKSNRKLYGEDIEISRPERKVKKWDVDDLIKVENGTGDFKWTQIISKGKVSKEKIQTKINLDDVI